MTPEQTTDYFNKVFANQHSRITGRTHTFSRAKKTSDKDFARGSRSLALTSGGKKSNSARTSKKDLQDAVTGNLKTIAETEGADGLQGALESLWGGIKGGAGALVPDQAGGAISRSLDLISRPAYGLFNTLKAQSDALNEGQQPWETLDEGLGGLWGGISGKEKTGFGEFVESVSKSDAETNRTGLGKIAGLFSAGPMFAPQTHGMRLLNTAADEDPDNKWLNETNKWGKRVYGLAGEVGLDPLNLVGGGVVANVASTGASTAGRRLGVDLVKEATQNAAAKAAKEAIQSSKKYVAKGATTWRTADQIGADEAGKAIDEIVLELVGGGQRGRVNLGGATFVPTVAARASNAVKNALLSKFEARYERLWSAGTPSGMSPAEIASARKVDPIFDEVMTKIEDAMDLHLQNKGPAVTRSMSDEFAAQARMQVDDQVTDMHKRIVDSLADEFYNSPGIRVGKNTYSPPGFKRMGRAYRAVNRKGFGSPGAINYSKAMPGRMGLINQRAKSMGAQIFDAARKQDIKIARTLTHKQREWLQEAIHLGHAIPADMKEQADYLVDQYRKIWDMEVQAGVRAPDEVFAPNYTYTFNRPSVLKPSKKNIKQEFKKERKEAIKNSKANPNHRVTMGVDEAKTMGLNPETDAFANLVYRRAKANRDLTRAAFTTDLVDHYGILAKTMTPEQLKKYGVKKVSKSEYLELKKLAKDGEEWYLPKEVMEVLDHFKKLSTLDFEDEAMDMLRIFDWGLNQFKFAATLPFPGFHFRNFVGDVFMGLLDGVNFNDYRIAGEIMDSRFAQRQNNFLGPVGRNYTPKVHNIGGKDMTADELWTLFKNNAGSGGYVSTDLNLPTGIPSRQAGEVAGRAKQTLTNVSEGREDLGRFAHFVKALKDEMPKSKNMDKAVEKATFRVNKYKFDYGALTATEKKYMRRMIPFYTYMRKAIPTLTESIFLSPQYLSLLNRQQQYNADNPMFARLAPWQQEAGMLFMSGGDQPLTMGAGVMPTSVLSPIDAIDPTDPLNFENAQDSAQGWGSYANPLLQAIPELATGKSIFSGNNISDAGDNIGPVGVPPLVDYLAKKFVPPYSTAQSNQSKYSEGFDPAQFVLGNRVMLGLGVDRLRTESQTRNLMSNVYELKGKFSKEVNPQLAEHNAYIYVSERKDGTSIRVSNNDTRDVLYDGDLQGALDFIKKQYGI